MATLLNCLVINVWQSKCREYMTLDKGQLTYDLHFKYTFN